MTPAGCLAYQPEGGSLFPMNGLVTKNGEPLPSSTLIIVRVSVLYPRLPRIPQRCFSGSHAWLSSSNNGSPSSLEASSSSRPRFVTALCEEEVRRGLRRGWLFGILPTGIVRFRRSGSNRGNRRYDIGIPQATQNRSGVHTGCGTPRAGRGASAPACLRRSGGCSAACRLRLRR
jgi:hypothetical protein